MPQRVRLLRSRSFLGILSDAKTALELPIRASGSLGKARTGFCSSGKLLGPSKCANPPSEDPILQSSTGSRPARANALHNVDCPIGFVPDAGSGGSAAATVVTPGPTRILRNSEMIGRHPSVCTKKPTAFRVARKTVYALPSATADEPVHV